MSFLVFVMVASAWHWGDPFEILGEIVEAFGRDPAEAFLALGIVIGVIEAVFALTGLLLAPWGCQDEPLGASLGHALSRTWLQTFHVFVFLMVLFVLISGLEELEDMYRSNSPWNTMEDWEEWQRTKPWFLRYGPVFIYMIGLGLFVWMFWALIRGIATPRPVAALARDPMCEFCGYSLVMMKMDGRCPECGVEVARSLGEDLRPGTAWDRRASIGAFRAYWRTLRQAIFRPVEFGRSLPVHRTDTWRHGSVFAIHVAVLLVLSGLQTFGMMFLIEMPSGLGPFGDRPWMLLGGLWSASWTVLLYVLLMQVWAVGVTLWYRVTAQRNLGRVAMAASCYAMVLPVLLMVFGGLSSLVIWFFNPHYFRSATGMAMNEWQSVLALVAWIPTVVIAVVYMMIVGKAPGGARWANGEGRMKVEGRRIKVEGEATGDRMK